MHYYLDENGKFFLLCFDFLGITEKFNTEPFILEIALKNGINCNIVSRHERQIRKGGKTEENIKWINKIYPFYKFKNYDNNLYHNIFIIEFKF